MNLVESLVIVGIGFKGLRTTEISIAVGFAVIGTQARQLRLMRVITAISMLEIVIRIVHVQQQTIDDMQGSFAYKLIALPERFRGIFGNK